MQARKGQRQAKKGTMTGKERQGTKAAGKERHKGRQGIRNGTKACKERKRRSTKARLVVARPA
jgi:hypothetical protein